MAVLSFGSPTTTNQSDFYGVKTVLKAFKTLSILSYKALEVYLNSQEGGSKVEKVR